MANPETMVVVDFIVATVLFLLFYNK